MTRKALVLGDERAALEGFAPGVTPALPGNGTGGPVGLIGKKHRAVPLELIVAGSAVQRRKPFDPEHDEEDAAFLASVRERGQRLPVSLRPIPGTDPTRYAIKYGHRRIAALRQLGHPTVEAIVEDGPAVEADLDTLVENVRRNPSPVEQARTIATIQATHGLSLNEIAEKGGLKRRNLSDQMKLLESGAAILDALDRELFGIRVAIRLAIAPEEARARLAELAAAQAWSEETARRVVAHMTEFGTSPDEAATAAARPVVGDPGVPASESEAASAASGRRAQARRRKSVSRAEAAQWIKAAAPSLREKTAAALADAAAQAKATHSRLHVATLLVMGGQDVERALASAGTLEGEPGVKRVLALDRVRIEVASTAGKHALEGDAARLLKVVHARIGDLVKG